MLTPTQYALLSPWRRQTAPATPQCDPADIVTDPHLYQDLLAS